VHLNADRGIVGRRAVLRRREVVAFALLFLVYQLPEGVGQRWFRSFTLQAALLLAFFPVAYLVGRWLRSTAARAYALESSVAVLRSSAILFVAVCVMKVIAMGIGGALGVYAVTAEGPVSRSLLLGLPTSLLITVFPSVAEDIGTRGFWFRLERASWTPVSFVVASSAIYVANHIYRLGQGPAEWTMLFAFGCAYAAAVARFGSLWPAVALHWGWNFANEWLGSALAVSIRSPNGSRLLSGAAHVVLLAVVMAWPGVVPGRRTNESTLVQ